MALSYYSMLGPFDYSIDDPELQSLLNADCYLVDPYDSLSNSADASDNFNSLSQPQQQPFFQKLSPSAGKKQLSAQSIAARQRRRRITAKTQELGKLVPGAHKMNTAQMLHSAYKYIKFLHAQLSLLQFQEQVAEPPFEGQLELQNLLESPFIQEKLYSTENCLLPHKLAEQLCPHDQMLKSNPHLLPTFQKDRSF